MADLNDIQRIDTDLAKASAEYADTKKTIEADKTLSDFGKRKKLEGVTFGYTETRRKLGDTRNEYIKEIRTRRHDAAFGVHTPTATEALNVDRFRNELRKMPDSELAAQLKTASTTSAKLVGAELYRRGKFDPINENGDKFDADALTDLHEFEQNYGEQRTRSQKYHDRIFGP